MNFKKGDYVMVLSGTERGYSFAAQVVRVGTEFPKLVLVEEVSDHDCKCWFIHPSDLEAMD